MSDGPLLVLGLGLDTQSFLAAREAGYAGAVGTSAVVVADDATDRVIDGSATAVLDARSAAVAEVAAGASMVVRSPGVPPSHPAVVAAVGAGVTVTTPTGLWLGTVGQRHFVVGITGTKGKSTTTAMAGDLAAAVGVKAIVAGNIGDPVWSVAADPGPVDVVLLEVSSYMAADTLGSPQAGVLTSLGLDHLTWHGSADAYRRDKLRLFACGEGAQPVLVPSTELVAIDAAQAAGLAVSVVDVADPRWDAPAAIFSERGFPRHARASLALAVSAMELGSVVVSDTTVVEVARHHEPLAGRFRTVGTFGGLRWIDDTLASNPMAAAESIAAVASATCTVLVGGTSREVDPTPLVEAVARRMEPTVCLGLPDNGVELLDAIAAAAPGVRCIPCVSVTDAVGRAAGLTPEGGVVLFSPAAPTPQRLGSYRERGQEFLEAAAALGV